MLLRRCTGNCRCCLQQYIQAKALAVLMDSFTMELGIDPLAEKSVRIRLSPICKIVILDNGSRIRNQILVDRCLLPGDFAFVGLFLDEIKFFLSKQIRLLSFTQIMRTVINWSFARWWNDWGRDLCAALGYRRIVGSVSAILILIGSASFFHLYSLSLIGLEPPANLLYESPHYPWHHNLLH